MKEYEIKVELGTMYYTLEAESEESAIDQAKDLIYDEAMYNLLSGAKYTIHEEASK